MKVKLSKEFVKNMPDQDLLSYLITNKGFSEDSVVTIYEDEEYVIISEGQKQ